MQHANTAFLLAFCMLYSFFHGSYGGGLVAWLISLFCLYGYDLARNPELPEYDMKTRKILSSLAGWVISIFMLGLLLDDYSLLILFAVLLLFFCVLALSYWKRFSHEHFDLALVLRGEARYLGDIEEYIQESYVRNNRVELMNPRYSGENLRIVNESECPLAEFKQKRLPMSRREKEPEHKQAAFSCVLHGEWRYLTEIRAYIADQYLSDAKIRSLDFAYSIGRLYIVSESEWKAYEDFPGKS